jgi:adenine/guanine/hypoxanthine permease
MGWSTRAKSDGVVTERLPWWVSGDLNAAFGLGFNVLVNVLVLASLGYLQLL